MVSLARGPRGSRSQRLALAAAMVVLGACGRSVDLDGDGGDATSGETASTSKSSGSKSTSAQGSGGTSSTSGEGGGAPTSASTEVTTTGASTGTGPVCGGFGDACTECQSESCSAVWCGCVENPECLAAFDCWGDCAPSDMACNQACTQAHPSGIAAALLVSDCAASTCQDSCGWGTDVAPCAECLYASCAEATNACIADAECVPLNQCLGMCSPSNIQCQQQCYEDHGDGVDTLQALIDCSAMSCQAACG